MRFSTRFNVSYVVLIQKTTVAPKIIKNNQMQILRFPNRPIRISTSSELQMSQLIVKLVSSLLAISYQSQTNNVSGFF